MERRQLTDIIAKKNPLLANAVGAMVDFVTDRWSGNLPTKEQTQAVNKYIQSIVHNKNDRLTETDIAHREIAGKQIVIDSIRCLTHEQIEQEDIVIKHIANDPDYYISEHRGMHR